jgi:hypothetical protein
MPGLSYCRQLHLKIQGALSARVGPGVYAGPVRAIAEKVDIAKSPGRARRLRRAIRQLNEDAALAAGVAGEPEACQKVRGFSP